MNQTSLHRLLASNELDNPEKANLKELFDLRLSTNLSIIQNLFFSLYPEPILPNSFPLLELLPELFKKRPVTLQIQDLKRLKNANWYQSEKMVGMQLYVDHFNKDLKGLETKIPYFEKLGVNLLHIMPVTTRPKGENDGGYAVNSYTQVDKKYGSKTDLLNLTKKLRSKNMHLMMDFVVNHTSDEFPWAKKAMAGDKKYQDYYYTYPDRNLPDEFEHSLPEVFPQTSPGNFTFNTKMNRWVMTVFNDYQWDLNYTNPMVFMDMLTNLVELANLGVDVIRFDALAFLWKKLGTNSQNLPEAHSLITLFRMCLQVVAPGVVLLAEAIVSPQEIIKYFGEGIKKGNECEIAYNATLMALLWNSIATKKTHLLYKNLMNLPMKPIEGTWINYIRCHDDIGLSFDDRYIYEVGWDASSHRKFLLDYYCQKLDWSPAMGEIFMYNPKNGDGRITGSAASLLGLEKGIAQNNQESIKLAVNKILMLHAIILSYGGIPMIYAGDEIGTLNDYSYLKNKALKEDSRWANRPKQDWKIVSELDKIDTPQTQIFRSLKKLIRIRKNTPVFADKNNLVLHQTSNPHIFMFERTSNSDKDVLVICNFDESIHVIDAAVVASKGYATKGKLKDLVLGESITLKSGLLEINPFQILWLSKS
ncbi:MAG: alpha-amylase family protein [Eudoraea sp.]|uniref:alpha-amylase family protein n=1 Tax=Eudoraea sp. TaxID=1979955 RepID=UPI003C752D27